MGYVISFIILIGNPPISGVITLLTLLFSLGYHDQITNYLKVKAPETNCLSISLQDQDVKGYQNYKGSNHLHIFMNSLNC